MTPRSTTWTLAVVIPVLAALGPGCGDSTLRPFLRRADGGASEGPVGLCTACGDFPAAPIIVQPSTGPQVPAAIATAFGPAAAGTTTGGPCLIEPEMGSLFPRNWLRPRFRWRPQAAGTIVELRLHIDIEMNDLVVYTSGSEWTMDLAIWHALSRNAADHAIAVTVRSLDTTKSGTQPALGTHGPITIAPVEAPGSIVYWAIKARGDTSLNGFQIGDESSVTVVSPTPGRCVGCHSSTPDGEFVAFSDADPGDGQFASVTLRSARDGISLPSFETATAATLLARRNQHLAAFSPAHWRPGDRVALSLLNLQVVWTDLEANSPTQGVSWGGLVLAGDPGPASAGPSWSHDGTFVVYASGAGTNDGGLLTNADIYSVPYNDRHGGTAAPIVGASDKAWNEFYPTLSPDDQLLAFSRAPVAAGDSYNNRQAEVFVVSARGGTPQRLAANDPCPCLGVTSPGVTNSWSKWAPDATVTDGKVYYWLTFSSTRGETRRPQLYVTPVAHMNDVDSLVTYPALYLWNQPADEGNHTPAWDSFQIPPIP